MKSFQILFLVLIFLSSCTKKEEEEEKKWKVKWIDIESELKIN